MKFDIGTDSVRLAEDLLSRYGTVCCLLINGFYFPLYLGVEYVYLGIDLVEEFLNVGTKKYGSKDVAFKKLDYIRYPFMEDFVPDYAISSQTFNDPFMDGNNLEVIKDVMGRAFSICRKGISFNFVMGEIVKEDVNYTPTIYKGFCYETAFYGPEDYVASAPSLSKATNENLLSNVSYLWDERVSICGDVKRRFIWNTKVFKGLKKHKSQYAVLHARSIVNADNVFWIKRTDNLLRKANISTTSGDESKLNDFMVIDTDDIITKDPLEISYGRALWKPNENACEIAIEFDEPQDITEIIFHGNPVENKKIPVQIEIYDEKGFQTKINSLEPYGRATKIALSISRASKLIFKLSDYLEDFGLSEIELFDGEFKGHFDNQPPVNMSYSNNSIINAIDLLGYKFIVLITKIQRKIKKLFV